MPASARATWTSNGVNVAGFIVERKDPLATAFEEVGRTTAIVKTFTDSTLLYSKTYTYRICAFNSEGRSGPFTAEQSVTTVAEPLPQAPTGLTVVAL